MVEGLEVRAQVVVPLEVDGAEVAAERRLARVRPLVHRQVGPPLEHPEMHFVDFEIKQKISKFLMLQTDLLSYLAETDSFA